MNQRERVQRLKTDIPVLFIALKHKETPIISKIAAAKGSSNNIYLQTITDRHYP